MSHQNSTSFTPQGYTRNLFPEDRHRLEVESGIDPEIIAARGYWTATDPAELAALGFARQQCRVPALVIPEWSTAGFQVGYKIRPHTPRTDTRNGKAKVIKYESPLGSQLIVDAGPNNTDLRNPAIPLYITEGSRKVDALTSRGLCAVSLSGVYGFSRHKMIIPDFDDIDFRDRDVILSFDSDVATKREVADALGRLAAAVKRRGAGSVKASYLPHRLGGEKNGIDDFFADGHTIADYLATIRDIDASTVLDVTATAADAEAQLIAELKTENTALKDEIRAERAERADERRILGDSRRPAQERIAAVMFAWETKRIAQHGDGTLGRGNGLDPVVAVDTTGAIFTSVKGLAESSGTSPKNMGAYLEKWTAEKVIDRLPVTRVKRGEVVTRDGEIKVMYESTARIRPRGNLGTFLHDMYMAAPHPKPKAPPKPKDRCMDHPDADLIRRSTTECSICHQPVGDERASWVAAGTTVAADTTERTAELPFIATTNQNTPPVISENAPQVISERHRREDCRPLTPHVSLTTPQVISEILHSPGPDEKTPTASAWLNARPVAPPIDLGVPF